MPPAPLMRSLMLSVVAVLATSAASPQQVRTGNGGACESDALRPGGQPLDTWVDSALLATALRPRWNPDWRRVVATLTPAADSADAPDRVWVGALAGDPEGLDRIGQWLVEARTDAPLPEHGRVGILVGDRGEFRLTGVVTTSCAPELLNPGELSDSLAMLRRVLRANYDDEDLRRMEALVWIRVDEAGRPAVVEIREPSRDPIYDTRVLGIIRGAARFAPARRAGIPIPVWVQIPVTFRMGG